MRATQHVPTADRSVGDLTPGQIVGGSPDSRRLESDDSMPLRYGTPFASTSAI